MIERECPVSFSTAGPENHFFGYYDKSPIDRSGERLLSHRAAFDFKRLPHADDVIEIGYWNLDDGRYDAVATTRAYNWQQGAQLQWLGPDHETRIIFNDRDGETFVSRVVDLSGNLIRTLPFPVYTVASNGSLAICVNYPRLSWAHVGYHYEGAKDARWSGSLPDGDGLFRLDLKSAEVERIIRTRDLTQFEPLTSMKGALHYVEHAMFNPSGSRFHFHHRWMLPDGGIYGRLFAANPDGSELRLLLDTGYVSHCGWRDDETVVGWGRPASPVGALRRSRFISRAVLKPLLPLYHALTSRVPAAREKLLGDTYIVCEDRPHAEKPRVLTSQRFPGDGHCTWRPGDDRWMLTDTYEDADSYRNLLLYDAREDRIVRIGRFYSLPETNSTGWRADLHPRWDYSGRSVCIDSTHTGQRQMHVIDVSEIVGA